MHQVGGCLAGKVGSQAAEDVLVCSAEEMTVMTALLDRAIAELKKRADREQDDVARDILARIGEPQARAHSSVFGRGRSVLKFVDANDDLIDILTEDDIGEWYAGKSSAG
jgi:hypothetical protein